jgi:hypothetical protein
MRRPSQNNCISGICCLLFGFAAAGRSQAAGTNAGQAIGFPNLNARSGQSSVGQNDDLGVGLFSNIPFRITLTVRGGYDDNSSTSSTSGQGSAFISSTVNLNYDFGSPRTRLSLQVGGGITDYFDRKDQSGPDYNAYLGLSLRHSFSARLILNVTAYASYQAEPDFSIGTGLNRRSGNYFYTNDRFSVTYLWAPRFSTDTSYTFGTLLYDNSGASGAGSFENRIENTFSNDFRFLLWPTTTLVAQYRIQFVSYQNNDTDAINQYILGGFDHTFSPRFRITYRGGLQIRSSDSTQTIQVLIPVPPFFTTETIHTSTDSAAPYFEGTATYEVAKKTSLTWTSRYSIEEPDIPGQTGRTTFRTGLEGTHNWTPRISSRVAMYYSHDHYAPSSISPSFNEDSIDMALSLRYAITRYLGIETGYNYTDILSDISGRGYSRNRVYLGGDFAF